MKAKDLIKLLADYGDFEVVGSFLGEATSEGWPNYKKVSVSGVADVGFSSQVVVLDLEEREE